MLRLFFRLFCQDSGAISVDGKGKLRLALGTINTRVSCRIDDYIWVSVLYDLPDTLRKGYVDNGKVGR